MAICGAKAAAPSLVVAASMGAVEALKDQAGLCRWDYALRSLYLRAAAASSPRLRSPLSNTAAAAARPPAEEAADVRLRKVHHLVCWGPN
ncbi:uncharacterized protein LOC127761341 [Oryza glaberrima]|uniref:Uncharacterized protein n=2 Tax=Oryza TaxID=4527 RepID=A0A0D3F109_9ORYZ|nr:uncharacterized protein LOC127761341 [Oryza glaberrima]